MLQTQSIWPVSEVLQHPLTKVVSATLSKREASNPVIQRGPGFLSQVIKINIVDYLYGEKQGVFNPSSNTNLADDRVRADIMAKYTHDPVVHDGILKVFDGFYYKNSSSTKDYIADVMYANEVYTFSALGDLQGVCIPRLVDYGCFFNADALEDQLKRCNKEGHVLDGPYTISENVGSLKVDPQNAKHYEAALHSLQMVHGLNVCHGDVRIQNMILQRDGRVMFIDFGHSQVFDLKDAKEVDDFEVYKFQDMLKLKRIFQL